MSTSFMKTKLHLPARIWTLHSWKQSSIPNTRPSPTTNIPWNKRTPTAYVKLHALESLSSSAFQLILYIQKRCASSSLRLLPWQLSVCSHLPRSSCRQLKGGINRERPAANSMPSADAGMVSTTGFKQGSCWFAHPDQQGFPCALEQLCKFKDRVWDYKL